MNVRYWFLMPLLVLVAVSVAGCGTQEETEETTEVRVALDWFPWSNHSGLYIALEKGYYDDENLDVTIYTPDDPSTVLLTVGAGQDDFGLSYQSAVLLALEQDVPVVSIAALVQHPLNSVMALKSSGIERPRDLKGGCERGVCKVGFPGLPTDSLLLETMLKTDGITLDDVEMVNVGFDLVLALISEQVDAIVGAYWVHESISAENQGFPVNIMRMEDWGIPDFYEIVLVASEEMINDNSDLVQRFIRATMRGYREAVANPQEAIDILAQAAPEIDEAIERPGVDLLSPLWIEGDLDFGLQTADKWVAFSVWMRENGLLTSDVDANAAFTNRFVEGAQ